MSSKYVTILFAITLMTGCASGTLNIATHSKDSSQIIEVVDERPASDRQTDLPGFGEATYYLGDDRFQPNIIEALRSSLTWSLDEKAHSTKVVVKHTKILNYFGKHDNAANTAVLGPIWSNLYENKNFIRCDISGVVNSVDFNVTYAEPYEVKSLAYLVVYNSSDANDATIKVTKRCIAIASEKIATIAHAK